MPLLVHSFSALVINDLTEKRRPMRSSGTRRRDGMKLITVANKRWFLVACSHVLQSTTHEIRALEMHVPNLNTGWVGKPHRSDIWGAHYTCAQNLHRGKNNRLELHHSGVKPARIVAIPGLECLDELDYF